MTAKPRKQTSCAFMSTSLVRRCQRGAFVLQIPERPDSFATTLFAHEPLCESDQGRIWRKAEVGQLVVRHRGAVPTTQASMGINNWSRNLGALRKGKKGVKAARLSQVNCAKCDASISVLFDVCRMPATLALWRRRG